MADAYVIFNDQLLHARDDVQMSNRNVVVDLTFTGVDDAQPDANSFADPVTKKPAIESALEKRRQKREQSHND